MTRKGTECYEDHEGVDETLRKDFSWKGLTGLNLKNKRAGQRKRWNRVPGRGFADGEKKGVDCSSEGLRGA